MRAVSATAKGPATTVAQAASGRSTGIPMMARAGGDAIVAWRQGTVKTARVALPAAANSRAR